MTHLQVPGFPIGDLSKEGNFAAYIDRAVLAGHMYRPVYDPEGILSTLPAIASGLFGNLGGYWLKSSGAPARKFTGCLQGGIIFLLAGWKWGQSFPVNKALWTSSFVLETTGWALVLLSVCYGLIEIRGWKAWSKPFEVFGVNAIAAYFLHVFFLKVQNKIPMTLPDGTQGNLRFFITDHLFSRTSRRKTPLLAYALSYTLLWLAVLSGFFTVSVFSLRFSPSGSHVWVFWACIFSPLLYLFKHAGMQTDNLSLRSNEPKILNPTIFMMRAVTFCLVLLPDGSFFLRHLNRQLCAVCFRRTQSSRGSANSWMRYTARAASSPHLVSCGVQ